MENLDKDIHRTRQTDDAGFFRLILFIIKLLIKE